MNSTAKTYADVGYVVLKPKSKSYLSIIKRAFASSQKLAVNSDKLLTKWTHKSGKVKHVVNPHRKDHVFIELLKSPEVRAGIQALYGNTPMFVTHSKLSFKCANIYQVWLPHQDGAYKRHDQRGTTFAVFLENCDKKNGTLEVFPTSNKLGKLKHEIVFAAEEKEPQVKVAKMPDIKALPVEGKQGSLLMFDFNTIHQSGFNSRGGLRSIYIFEVEPIGKQHPLEEDGRNAIVLNTDGKIRTSPLLPLIKIKRRVFERVLKPKAKKALFYVYQMLGKRGEKMAQ
jgi:ectoine hydroxylase-related dioxygenase (phytanoyl-CoA dioxygenase family)